MDDKLETERRGVKVSKGIEVDESGMVRITWRINSDHGDQILICVTDPIPPDTTVQLPSGDDGDWQESDEQIEYERTLSPEATLTTGYRLDCEDPAAAADAQEPPSVHVGAPVGERKKSLTRGETDQVFTFNDGRSPDTVSPPPTSRGAHETEHDVGTDAGTEFDQFLGTIGEFNAPDDELSMTDIISGRTDSRDNSDTTGPHEDDDQSDGGDDTTDAVDPSNATANVDGLATEPSDGDRPTADSSERRTDTPDSENRPTGDGDDQQTDVDDDTSAVGDEGESHSSVGDEGESHSSVGDEGESHSSGGDTEASASEGVNASSDDIVETFIRHLEAGLSEEQATRLQEGLTDAVMPRSSLEVRVMYLQSRFQELSAYIDALEEFIDEHGSGDRVLAELTDDVETVQAQLEHGEAELDTLTARVDSTETHTESLETAFESRQHSVDDKLSELESAIEDVRDGQQALDDRVSGLETFRDSLKDAM